MGIIWEQSEVVLHLFQVKMNVPAHSSSVKDYSNSQTKTRIVINVNTFFSKNQGSFTSVPSAFSIKHANWVISIAERMAEMCN